MLSDIRERAAAYVDEIWEDAVSDIAALVAIDSVEDKEHAAPGMPFGPKPAEALACGLSILDKLGLATTNCDGFIGFGDLEGASPRHIATIAHTDIVPTGEGWSSDPLTVNRREGFLVGRGVQDDKGPFVLSAYAAHFFVREYERTGHKLPYTLRCIVGCNEETGMEDVEWYLAHYEQPAFCFTPDAEFPLICGEKGVYHATIRSGKIAGGKILELDGGTVANAIPSKAIALVVANADELPQSSTVEVISEKPGVVRLIAHGKGGHASMPEGTENAIGILVAYLLANDICSDAERQFLRLEAQIHASTDGSSLGIDAHDEYFSPLTCIGGTIRTQDACFVQTIDVRYPTSTTAENISATMEKLCGSFGCSFEVNSNMVPFLTDPESAPIRTLVATYNELTGNHDEAFTIGGGTYGRHFERACAFGPYDPRIQVPEWVGTEHSPDEGISEEQLKLALRIYIESIARLMELKL